MSKTLKELEHELSSGVYQIQESGNDEWYTPLRYIESVRKVLSTIDLDPASNDIAQSTIKATKYFTKEKDGLIHDWSGSVFMNPPYSRQLMKSFIEKLIMSKGVSEYVCLTNSSTDTQWFHNLAKSSDVMCFTKGRISFVNSSSEKKNGNSRGQVFFYKGDSVESFIDEFSQYGICVNVTKQTS